MQQGPTMLQKKIQAIIGVHVPHFWIFSNTQRGVLRNFLEAFSCSYLDGFSHKFGNFGMGKVPS
jgi:hypothetical protein